MRTALVLNQDFSFYPLHASFPLDAVFIPWMQEDPGRQLGIFSAAKYSLANGMEQQCTLYPYALPHQIFRHLRFQQTRKQILSFQPDLLVFDGWQARRQILLQNIVDKVRLKRIPLPSVVVMQSYRRATLGDDFFLQQIVSLPSEKRKSFFRNIKAIFVPQYGKRLLYDVSFLPSDLWIAYQDLPSPSATPLEESLKEKIKEEITGGNEYFFCSGIFHQPEEMVLLLKAFSSFKKHLKSGIKLMFTGVPSDTEGAMGKWLQQYKYKNELILVGRNSGFLLHELAGAAYAQVFPSDELSYATGPLESYRCRVPVLMPAQGRLSIVAGSPGYAFTSQAQSDLAQKMMNLFKDEPLRNRLVKEGLDYLAEGAALAAVQNRWEVLAPGTAD